MLLSHCGEYMANGLTNAVRHEFVMIANDRQIYVAVRKHSRSFLWCFECYVGLTSGECMENGLKPLSHRIVRSLDRTIGCYVANVRPIGNVCYDRQQRSHTAIGLSFWW